MEETFLYKKVAESIRRQIILGELKSGDKLPSIREMKERWNCTLGTVQRAYQELGRQGLTVSRSGQGTRIADQLPTLTNTPLRQANLVNRAENFLLEVITAGYSPDEIEQSIRLALDRFRTYEKHKIDQKPNKTICFSGSHDLAISWIAGHFKEATSSDYTLDVKFSGSLAGLISLSEGQSDLAGCHLWDEESDTYNIPFIRRILPSVRCAIVTLAHRRLGIITAPQNPYGINDLGDLNSNPRLRFINRQAGSGTRVWLDAMLHRLNISHNSIQGYGDEKLTHSEIAKSIAEGDADVGIGLEAAAFAYGLNFIHLTKERYDLVIPDSKYNSLILLRLIDFIKSEKLRSILSKFGGYETTDTGKVSWIE